MLIKTKYIDCASKSVFNTWKLPTSAADTSGDIYWSAVVYIKDTGEVWTHGKLYGGFFSNADNNKVSLTIGGTTKILALDGHVQSYTTLTGSGSTADQAILSTGEANKWTLKTLGKNAFSNVDYLPADATAVAAEKVVHALAFQYNGKAIHSFDGSVARVLNIIQGDNVFITGDSQGNVTIAADPGSDTVNTAGATNKVNTKLFLIGAESQTTAPQTYSNQYVYIGTDNCLYSLGKKVLTEHQAIYNLDLQTQVGEAVTKVTTFDPNAANNSFTLVQGTNVTLTPDAANKKVTISSKDTTYDFYNLVFKQGESVIDTYKPTTSPSKTLKAGTNVTFTGSNNEVLITTQDTRNTAGATEKLTTKLFLTGALTQTDNPQTYTNSKVYIGADNKLYSDGKVVSTGDHTHPIYVTLDTEQTINGSKTFTTPIISTVASGTAPLVVASNTLVSNLNADLLDGLHAKSFIFYKEEDFDPATYDGYYMGMTTKSGINGDWWHIISMNWGGSNMGIVGNKTWVTQLALPTRGIRGLKYRTGNDSTSYGSWVDILDVTNYAGTLDGRYLKKTGDTMTGTLTSASTSSSIVFKGLENCDITNIYKDNEVIRNDDGGLTSIRNGLRFNWYDTYWYIGNLRGSSTDSAGFGVVDHNNKLVLRVTPNDVRAPRFMSTVATGLSPLIVSSNTLVNNLNADLLDGFHAEKFLLSVGRSDGTFDLNTYSERAIKEIRTTEQTTNNAPFAGYGLLANLWDSNKFAALQIGATSADLFFRGKHDGTNKITSAWHRLLHTENYASIADGRYVKKAGDTMTGTLGMGANTIYWKENGFGDKFGLTPYFSGTDDSNYLAFMSSVGAAGTDPTMTAKMVLTGLGNVGIGTTTPTQKLHVIGGGLFTALLTTTGITNNGTLTQNGDIIINQASTTGTRQVRFQGGDNDYGRVAYGGTASNAGWMEIASCDDGNEPIYARQYTGVFTTVKRTATLLDANGNTVFPGTVTAPTFTGALNGTAEWSKRLATNSQLTFGLNGLTYFNANLGAGTAANQNVGPTAQWWHILRMNHGNGSGYFADIAVPLNTSDGIYWRRIQGGTNYGWYRVLDTNNYAGIIDGRYVNVTGDTMTGALSVATHLEVRAANTTTNAMLILHNPNRSWGNITFRDNMFYFVDGNSSTGTTYRPIKANYYIASATTLCTNLNADLLDGLHENSFLRYRDAYGNDGYNTLWSQIGIRQYNNAKPDGMANPIYNYGAVISLPGANTRLDIWYNHTSSASDSSTNGIQYRSGWGTDKKPWRMLLDSVNAKHYNVGSATKLQTARQINGTNFDGTANIVTSYWGTARNFTIGNTTRSVNGSGNVTWSFADIGGAPASHSHNYINSRGNLNPQTGRTQNLGNVYSYNTVSGTSNGAPTTCTSVIGFGRSTGGTVEIAGGWTAGMGLWYRALRDTTDNWYGWVKVWDTKNFDPNSKANSNHNHDGSYITKGGSNNNVVLGAGGYRALSDFTLNSNWAASKNASGYVKFPNGFIIQWGEAYVGANSTGYKFFPIAFPTACISVQVTHKTTATNWDKVCVAGDYTRTSCTIANGETVNSMINWMALGY